MSGSAVVDVLEKLLSRKLLTAADQAHQPPVVDRNLVRNAAFTAKLQQQSTITDEPRVTVAQRRETVARVVADISGVADANARGIEQTDDDCKDLVARQAGLIQIL